MGFPYSTRCISASETFSSTSGTPRSKHTRVYWYPSPRIFMDHTFVPVHICTYIDVCAQRRKTHMYMYVYTYACIYHISIDIRICAYTYATLCLTNASLHAYFIPRCFFVHVQSERTRGVIDAGKCLSGFHDGLHLNSPRKPTSRKCCRTRTRETIEKLFGINVYFYYPSLIFSH